jgi:RNA polymerase sigma-70 factor (ECF subfamily)
VDDSKIIDLFFERSEQAIAALSQKYGAVCNAIARNILKNSLDAEECVNDAYFAAWDTIPPQKPDPLLTYICRIVRNLSIKKYQANTSAKRNSFYDTSLDELEECLSSLITVESEVQVNELSHFIDKFLDTLDKENRIIFVQRYWYGESVSAIAGRFKFRPNHVSVRLLRTREKLKQYLKKEGFEV